MPYRFNIFTGTFDIVSSVVTAITNHFLLESSGAILCEDGTYLTME